MVSLPKISPYRKVWDSFLSGGYTLCVSNEILAEYMEVISEKTSSIVANNVLSTILNAENVIFVTPYYRFGLISEDVDDNKFVDCCIAANASLIVSNDHHFDVLREIKFPSVCVISLSEFEKRL